jgi:O-antigen ligase
VVDPLIQAVGGAEIGLSDLTLLGPGQFSDDLRLRGFGVSENRLAAWILLPVFLAMAWAITTKSIVSKMVALIALSMLIGGLIGAVSRSGFLGLVVGLLIIAISAYGTGRYKFVLMFLIGAVVTILLLRTTLGDIAILRFEDGDLVSDLRTGLWKASIHEFLRSPIIVGVGYGNFDATNYSGYYGAQSHSHNAALQLLVESGIVAALLFVALMARSIWVLTRSSINETGAETIWRIAFMAGLVAVLVTDMFHVFTFDRFLWIALGFATAWELRLRGDNDVCRVKSTAEAQ